jgi:hypothetical protein
LPSLFCAALMSACVIVARWQLSFLPEWEKIALLVPLGAVVYCGSIAAVARSEVVRVFSMLRLLSGKTLAQSPGA